MKPSKAEIEDKVIREVATFARLTPGTVRKNLKRPLLQLGLDHVGLVHLAASLRAYIQFHKPTSTLLVAEIEKDDFTVENLVELVQKRIK